MTDPDSISYAERREPVARLDRMEQAPARGDPGSGTRAQADPSKAERRAARAAVGAYHEAELVRLLEHVREGLERYDAGEVDAFELDE